MSDPVYLWRYMDIAKFVNLLSGRLWFSSPPTFDDDREGQFEIWAYALDALLERKFGEECLKDEEAMASGHRYGMFNPQRNLVEFAKTLTRACQFAHVSCWHMNDCESAAMWQLYLKSNAGIAIKADRTEFDKELRRACANVHFCEVEYIDLDHAGDVSQIKAESPVELLRYKRKSFSHEQEYLAIISTDIPSDTGLKQTTDPNDAYKYLHAFIKTHDGPPDIALGTINNHLKNSTLPPGISVDIDPSAFASEVIVAPNTPAFVERAIRDVMSKFDFKLPLRRSGLDRVRGRIPLR